MTQTEAVLAELRRRGPAGLTALEAMAAGCGMGLAARVADLKAAGHRIDSTMVTVPTRGAPARVARYVLVERPEQLRWAS